MWHRDWLEEQRTGVPSTRGERYARYTTEQKRAAVDHYLTHGRRASRTMRRLGYPVLLQCLFDRFGSVFPQCGLMVFPGVVIVSR